MTNPTKKSIKRLLMSQRRDPVEGRDETRDSMDVRLAPMFYELGFLPIPLCSELHSQPDYLEALQPDAIFINSGNDLGEHPERDLLETQLLDYAKKHQLPVFAICRGTQLINHYQGGSLVPVKGHVASRIKLEGDWAKQQGYAEVNSFHNFAITQNTLGKDLEVLATSPDGVVKAIQHKTLPWLGIMWHPEREAHVPQADKKLIEQLLYKL